VRNPSIGWTSGLRRALRPWVFSARRLKQRAGLWIRPPLPWDGRHHPALLRFEPWQGEADGSSMHDFLGVKTAAHFRPQFRPDPPGPLRTSRPEPHAGYIELAFVLDSVLAAPASEPFRMLELGAGYGPWLAIAHRAVQLSSPRPVRLTGVEMVEQHFLWMHEHLRNNGIEPAEHRLIHAAASDHDGEAWFQPEPDPELDFGQRLIRRRPASPTCPGAGPSEPGRGIVERAGIGRRPVRTRSIDLRRLIAELEPLDLMHADMQGEELRALGHALPELNRRVGRLIVATHSRGIHRALRRLLVGSGWRTVYDFRCRARERTPFGDIQFLDGLLAVVNEGGLRGARTSRPAATPG
jgi:hypothetical protein